MKEITVSRLWLLSSVVIAVMVALASLLGILDPQIYSQETTNWALQARGQDTGNLIALPVLVLSTYFLARGSLKAYFIWLGTLLYLIYAYLIYSFAVHFNALFLAYVAILGLSIFTLIGGLLGQDTSPLQKTIPNTAKTKAGAHLLIIVGILFEVLWLSEVLPTLAAGTAPKSLAGTGLWVNPVHVIDLSVALPGMIITGFLFLRKSHIAYVFTAPWLVFSVLMGSSIVATMLITLMQGSSEGLQPLVLVGIIVLLSVIALFVYLREIDKN